jgi:hypothetical protein
MKSPVRLFVALSCSVLLTSCATQILESTDTTTTDTAFVVPMASTTTTLPIATGGIIDLLEQLLDTSKGLGQAIVDSDSDVVNARKNQANAIWVAIEPQIRAAEIDLVEDVQRLVGLINTAVNRKRPADADKVLLFLPPIITAAEKLLGES